MGVGHASVHCHPDGHHEETTSCLLTLPRDRSLGCKRGPLGVNTSSSLTAEPPDGTALKVRGERERTPAFPLVLCPRFTFGHAQGLQGMAMGTQQRTLDLVQAWLALSRLSHSKDMSVCGRVTVWPCGEGHGEGMSACDRVGRATARTCQCGRVGKATRGRVSV